MNTGVPRPVPPTPVTAPVAVKACEVYVPPASVTVTVGVAGLIVNVAPALVTL